MILDLGNVLTLWPSLWSVFADVPYTLEKNLIWQQLGVNGLCVLSRQPLLVLLRSSI